MKYKAGDKVRIKSLDWYNENNDGSGILSYKISGVPFTSEMAEYCGCIVTIDKVIADAISCLGDRYNIKEDGGDWMWHDKMFEGLAEEDNPFDDNIPLPDSFVERTVHKIADSELFNAEPLDIPTMTTDFVKDYGLPCPDGYEFRDENGNVINASKIVLEKKKPKYPNNFYHSVRTLGLHAHPANESKYKEELIHKFHKLLICRDAYWKMAGEEMGLGKPWEPDWTNEEWPDMAYISYDGKSVDKENGFPCCNMILIFPTEEMRDAFYENFKELIEECKELL